MSSRRRANEHEGASNDCPAPLTGMVTGTPCRPGGCRVPERRVVWEGVTGPVSRRTIARPGVRE
jgi:hypothetical protein